MQVFADLKRLVSVLISGVAGALVLLALFLQVPAVDILLEVAQVATAVALLLGLVSVVVGHLQNVARRARGWGSSLIIAVVAILIFGLELLPQSLGLVSPADAQELSALILRYVFQPLATSTLGLLAFFALRASWRALGHRPGEAVVILAVAVIFLVAAGPWAGGIPGLREALDWVRTYPVAGVTRGLLIGASLGAIVTTVRVLLGFDAPYLDR
jgi:hypothetical protein